MTPWPWSLRRFTAGHLGQGVARTVEEVYASHVGSEASASLVHFEPEKGSRKAGDWFALRVALGVKNVAPDDPLVGPT